MTSFSMHKLSESWLMRNKWTIIFRYNFIQLARSGGDHRVPTSPAADTDTGRTDLLPLWYHRTRTRRLRQLGTAPQGRGRILRHQRSPLEAIFGYSKSPEVTIGWGVATQCKTIRCNACNTIVVLLACKTPAFNAEYPDKKLVNNTVSLPAIDRRGGVAFCHYYPVVSTHCPIFAPSQKERGYRSETIHTVSCRI